MHQQGFARLQATPAHQRDIGGEVGGLVGGGLGVGQALGLLPQGLDRDVDEFAEAAVANAGDHGIAFPEPLDAGAHRLHIARRLAAGANGSGGLN